MTEIFRAVEFFIYGAIVGFFAPDFFRLCKICIQEFKVARKEWKQ